MRCGSPGIPRDRGLSWLDGYIPFPIKSTLFGLCFLLTGGSDAMEAGVLGPSRTSPIGAVLRI